MTADEELILAVAVVRMEKEAEHSANTSAELARANVKLTTENEKQWKRFDLLMNKRVETSQALKEAEKAILLLKAICEFKHDEEVAEEWLAKYGTKK